MDYTTVKLPPIASNSYIPSTNSLNDIHLPSISSLTTNFQSHNDSTIVQNDDSTVLEVNTTIIPQANSHPHPAKSIDEHSIIVDSTDVLNSIETFKNGKHLGSIIYNKNPNSLNYEIFPQNLNKDDQLSIKNFNGSFELLPSFLKNYLNCTIDIHIPRLFLHDNENVYNKKIWGTDIYTDDSDIVSILYHCGIIKSNDPTNSSNNFDNFDKFQEPKISNKGNLIEYGLITPGITPVNSKNKFTVEEDDLEENITDTLVVRLLILPTLTQYIGCYRNNYKSRTWKGPTHDGASIGVYSVRWSRKSLGINNGNLKRRFLDDDLKSDENNIKAIKFGGYFEAETERQKN